MFARHFSPPVTFTPQIALRKSIIGCLLGLQLIGTLMELTSLVILVPVFQYVQLNGDIEALKNQEDTWLYIDQALSVIGIEASLVTLLMTSFFFLTVRQFFVFIRLRFQAWAKETTTAYARSEGFKLHLNASIEYQEAAQAGGVVNDFTTELQRAIDNVFGRIAFYGLVAVTSVYVAGLVYISPYMLAMAIGVFGCALTALIRPMRDAERAGQDVAVANRSMSTFLVERLHHTRLVRLAGMERAETDQMVQLTGKQREKLINIFIILAKIEIIIEPIVIGAGFLFIYFSVTFLSLRIEQIGLFLVMILRLLPVVKEAARTRQANKSTSFSRRTVEERFAAARSAAENFDDGDALDALRRLEFRNVSYTYPTGNAPALAGISIDLPLHRMMALVGPSGAGKSTLADLIPRFRDAQGGAIMINDRPIGDFSLASVRRAVAYAPQRPQIFNTTIAEHIRYGKRDATDAEIVHAATLAGADGFIRALPTGYDTQVGEHGGAMSGGQAQRLDLARTLIRGAPILLLDEPTSNLDAESEEEFRHSLQRIRAGGKTTIIVIAHRLSTIKDADQIVVLDQGAIVATGAHDALMRSNSWYREAFSDQLRHDDQIVA